MRKMTVFHPFAGKANGEESQCRQSNASKQCRRKQMPAKQCLQANACKAKTEKKAIPEDITK